MNSNNALLKVKNLIIGQGMPKIIVPVLGKTLANIEQELHDLKHVNYDLIEWRLDHFEAICDFTQIKAVKSLFEKIVPNAPVIYTFRTHEEGGNLKAEDEFYFQLIDFIIQDQFCDFIDLELFTCGEHIESFTQKAHRNHIFVISSNHDFNKTPSKQEIIDRLSSMQKSGADVIKIAVMPKNNQDVATLLSAANHIKETYPDQLMIAIAMADIGMISRVFCQNFGSHLTFASANTASAPGQIAANELYNIFNSLHLK